MGWRVLCTNEGSDLTQQLREVTSRTNFLIMLRRTRKQEIYSSNGKVEPLNQATIVFTDLASYSWTKVDQKRGREERGKESQLHTQILQNNSAQNSLHH